MWEGRDGFCHYLRERLNASIRILSKHHYTSEVVPLFLSPLFLTWAGGIHATLQRLRADKAGWPACLLLIIITIFNFEFERTFCKGWKPPGNSIYFFIIIITLFLARVTWRRPLADVLVAAFPLQTPCCRSCITPQLMTSSGTACSSAPAWRCCRGADTQITRSSAGRAPGRPVIFPVGLVVFLPLPG